MRRRQFITLLGSAAAWPLTVHAQPSAQARKVGFLMNVAADNPEGQSERRGVPSRI